MTYSACQDQCNADEYAVACGGPGPASSASPPGGCRQLLATPGGVLYVCCPCGQAVSSDDGGSFACGKTAMCDGHVQVCEHVQGGAPPGVDRYDCAPIPSACDSDVSCACVTTAFKGSGAGDCSADGSNLTVQIDVP